MCVFEMIVLVERRPWIPATSVSAVQGMAKRLVSFAGVIIGLALVQIFFSGR
jgi:hypothetical protein